MNDLRLVVLYLGANIPPTEKRRLLLIFFITAISAASLAVAPLLLARATDEFVRNMSSDRPSAGGAYFAGLGYLIMLCIGRGGDLISMHMQTASRFRISAHFSSLYYKLLQRKDSSYFNKANVGRITQTLMQAENDLGTLIQGISSAFAAPTIQLGVAIFVLVHQGFGVISCFVLVYVLLFFVNAWYWNRKVLVRRDALLQDLRNAYSVLSDSIQNIKAVRVFRSFDFVAERYMKALQRTVHAQRPVSLAHSQIVFVNLLLFIVLFSSSFAWLSWEALNKNVSVGGFVMIASYIMFFSAPLEMIGARFGQMHQSLHSLANFAREFHTTRSDGDISLLSSSRSREEVISIDSLDFVYEGDRGFRLLVDSLVVKRGEKVAVLGKNGSGKSTLLDIIAGELSPQSGTVRLFGENVGFRGNVTADIGYVTQRVEIFQDTIEFNLRIAKPVATAAEIQAAIEFADLTSFVSSLPNGLHQTLGTNGTDLSGGQRQKISLARAILQKPKLLLVDEGTAALDAISEDGILNSVFSIFSDCTILFVSHRPRLLSYSGRVIEFSDGCIVRDEKLPNVSDA